MTTKVLVFIGITSAWASAQTANPVQRGEQLFTTTCGSGYCHGGKGVGGGAPRLAARGFDQGFITNTVSNGIAGTAMPGFASTLPAADVRALIAYVGSLNGLAIGGGPAPAAIPAIRSAEFLRGEALFSDAVRGFGRCSTCHQLGRLGIPVTVPIAAVPANAAALKNLATPRVSTVTVGSDAMPALVVAQKAQSVTFYDLTKPPPVLRNEEPARVQVREGSSWRHAAVIGAYSDSELALILAFLKEAAK